jgi:hypothetical protein
MSCTKITATSRLKPIPVRKTKFDPEAAGSWIVSAAAEALMVAPDVSSTTAVLPRVPHAMIRAATLLASAETTVATEDAKMLLGYIVILVPPERIAEVIGKNVIARVPAMRSKGEMVTIIVEVEPTVHILDRPIKK